MATNSNFVVKNGLTVNTASIIDSSGTWVGAPSSYVGAQGLLGPVGAQGTVGSQGVAGAQGAQGTVGAQGSQGAPGAQGSQGSAGVQGAQGSPGAQGTQGVIGAQGSQGAPGAQGAQGAVGAQGTQGAVGAQGRQGTIGAQGSQGAPGAQGAQGVIGTTGAQGITGIAGAQGVQGAQGAQGVQGVQGAQGAQGIQGAQGAQGTLGAQGVTGAPGAQGFTGPPGAQGIPGAQGSRGPTGGTGGVSPAGQPGATGTPGAQGATGAPGAQGAQGSAAPNDVGNTLTMNYTGGVVGTYSGSSAVRTINPTIIQKTSGTNGAWDGQAYSSESYTGGCFLAWNMYNNQNYIMVGLNTDPTSDASYSSIDYAWYPYLNGGVQIYESGNNRGEFFGTYGLATNFLITYDNAYVRYYINTVLYREVFVGSGITFYADSSIYYTTASYFPHGILSLAFGPYSNIASLLGPQGPAGPTGAPGGGGGAGPQGTNYPAGTTYDINTSYHYVGNLAWAPATPGYIRAYGEILSNYSDRRLKKNIEVIDNCLEKIQYMSGIYYTQNKLAEKYGFNNSKRQVGVIAQQINSFFPEVVDMAPFDIDDDGNSKSGQNYLTVKYDKIVALLIQAIKEQQLEIKELMEKIEQRGK